MGIFRQFPYSNFHDMNMDWIIAKVKELITEWASYNENWNSWQNDINTAFEDLKTWVETQFEELPVRTYVAEIIEELFETGEIEALLPVIFVQNQEIDGRVFLNAWDTLEYYVDGSVYVGDNKVVAYFSSNSTDTGKLKCFNTLNGALLWDYPILGYHGNSVTYRDGKVYICGCYSQTDPSTLIPTIVVVDLTNPSVVDSVITPPMAAGFDGFYSLTYADEFFYGICARGTAEGSANRLFKYNKELTEVVGYVDLVNYHALQGISGQGVQLVVGQYAYSCQYEPNNTAIQVHNITDGAHIAQINMKRIINGYRAVGEIESIYNIGDNICFFARKIGTGKSGSSLAYSAEIPIYSPVVIPYPTVDNLPSPAVSVEYDHDNAVVTNSFICLDDAVNFAKNYLNGRTAIYCRNNNIGSVNIQSANIELLNAKFIGMLTIENSHVNVINSDFSQHSAYDAYIKCINTELYLGSGVTFTDDVTPSYDINASFSLLDSACDRLLKVNAVRCTLNLNKCDYTNSVIALSGSSRTKNIINAALAVGNTFKVPINSVVGIYGLGVIVTLQVSQAAGRRLYVGSDYSGNRIYVIFSIASDGLVTYVSGQKVNTDGTTESASPGLAVYFVSN